MSALNMISFYQYLILFIISVLLSVSCIFAYDKIFVGKVPYKLLSIATIREILSVLDIRPNQTFVDLGCGDGRVLVEVAKLQPKLHCIGVEKAIFPYLIAKYKTRKHQNIQIILGDVTKYDFTKDNVVFVYLLPSLLDKLELGFIKLTSNRNTLVSVEYKPSNLEKYSKHILKNKSEFANHWYLYHN